MRRLVKLRTLLANGRGDTIVEVMIAVAVISLVLAGAYTMTTFNLNSSRDAQERVNAIKVAESQVESLKEVIALYPSRVFGSSAPATFCVTSSLAIVSTNNTMSGDAQCRRGTQGQVTTAEPSFRTAITLGSRNASDATYGQFTVYVRWNSFNGRDGSSATIDDNVRFMYRIYP